MSVRNCSHHHHHGSHLFEIICLTTEAGLILLINLAFLVALYRKRRSIKWKSTVFVANTAVSDFVCSFSLIAMLGNLFDIGTTDKAEHRFQYAMQLVTTYSLGITVLNYNALFLIQYFSIRRPLIYRTRCTRMIFVCFIAAQWIFLTGYVGLKAIMIKREKTQFKFSIGELVLMLFFTLINAGTYGYVLYVSAVSNMQQLERRREKTSQESIPPRGPKSVYRTLVHDYRNTVTAGLHLLVYISTFFPMWIVRVDVAVNGCPDHVHCTDSADIYACSCTACRVTFYVWYLRAILDPLLQITRDPNLRRELVGWILRLLPCIRRPTETVSTTEQISMVRTESSAEQISPM